MWEAAVNFVRMMIRRVTRRVPRSNGSRRVAEGYLYCVCLFCNRSTVLDPSALLQLPESC